MTRWPAACVLRCGAALVLTLALVRGACAEDFLSQGRLLFQQGNFDAAVTAFEQAVAREPDSAEAHDWLGRAYGRKAQQSSWVDAVRLARRSRSSFETAVELDPQYVPGLVDLIRFYRRAPRVLGGSEAKAAVLLDRLETIDPAAAQTLRDSGSD